MATKAQKFKSDETALQRARTPAPARIEKSVPPPAKTHNLSERAGRKAGVSYEVSDTKPSRKSTRGSKHHLRASNHIEHTEQLRQASPETRAAISRAQAIAVSGKPRRSI